MKNPRTITAADYLRRGFSEHRLQTQVLEHLALIRPNAYWFAIPNAARRGPALAAMLKREGMKAGIADLCIMLPAGRTCWLELKTASGRQSVAQKSFGYICQQLGHDYAVAHSLDEAIAVLKAWGALK